MTEDEMRYKHGTRQERVMKGAPIFFKKFPDSLRQNKMNNIISNKRHLYHTLPHSLCNTFDMELRPIHPRLPSNMDLHHP
jgi:hypothetical protein